jgi:hypothetical protein
MYVMGCHCWCIWVGRMGEWLELGRIIAVWLVLGWEWWLEMACWASIRRRSH